MVLLDNVSKVVEPLLVLSCAGAYSGGAWGSFKLAESVAYLLFRTSMLGLDRGVVWWFGRSSAEAYRKDLAGVLLLVLVASLVGAAAMIGISWFGTAGVKGMTLPFLDSVRLAAAIPMLALSEVLYQANLNRRDLAARIVGKNLVLPLLVFGGALAAHPLGGPGLPTWFLIGCAGNFVVAAGSFAWLHRGGGIRLRPSIPTRELLAYGLPLTGSDLLRGLTLRIDLMLLGSLSGIRSVEIYNVVSMVGNSLGAIRESFDGLLLSAFSSSGARRLTLDLRDRLNRASWTVGGLVGLALLVVLFWGRDFLGVLSSEYAEGYACLVTMGVLTWINVPGELSAVMLQGMGRSKASGATQVLGFAVNVVANFALVPAMGALGGIVALKGSQIVQGVAAQVVLARMRVGFPLWTGEYRRSRVGLAAAIAAAGGLAMLHLPISVRIAVTAAMAGLWWLSFRRSIQVSERVPAT